MRASLLTPFAIVATATGAQGGAVPVTVGTVASAQTCTAYLLSSGRETLVAGRRSGAVTDGYAAAYASSAALAYQREWRTRLVRDCTSDFPQLRATLRDALAATGRLRVGGGGYTLTVRLSPVGGSTTTIQRADMDEARGDSSVAVSYSLLERGGRAVFGGMLTKSADNDTTLNTAAGSIATSHADGGYARLQQGVALALARAVGFHLDPLRVVDIDGRRVRVNAGAPLLSLGDTLIVSVPGSLRTIKTEVVAVENGSALAEAAGGGGMDGVVVGGAVRFVEPEDAAANGRRYDRVDLP